MFPISQEWLSFVAWFSVFWKPLFYILHGTVSYGNRTNLFMLIYFHKAYDQLWDIIALVNSFNRNFISHKAENIFHLALYKYKIKFQVLIYILSCLFVFRYRDKSWPCYYILATAKLSSFFINTSCGYLHS